MESSKKTLSVTKIDENEKEREKYIKAAPRTKVYSNSALILATLTSIIEGSLPYSGEFPQMCEKILDMSDEEYEFFAHNFPYVPFADFILKTENAAIIKTGLKIISILSSADSNSVLSLRTNEFCEFLVSLFGEGDILEDIIHIIASLCYKDPETISFFVDKGILDVVQELHSSYSVNILTYLFSYNEECERDVLKVFLNFLNTEDTDTFLETINSLSILFLKTHDEEIRENIPPAFIQSAQKVIEFDDEEITVKFFDILAILPIDEVPEELKTFLLEKIAGIDASSEESILENKNIIRVTSNFFIKYPGIVQTEEEKQLISESMSLFSSVEALGYRITPFCFICFLKFFDFENSLDEEMLRMIVEKSAVPVISFHCYNPLLQVYVQTKREDVFEALTEIVDIVADFIDDDDLFISEKSQIFIEVMNRIEEERDQ